MAREPPSGEPGAILPETLPSSCWEQEPGPELVELPMEQEEAQLEVETPEGD